MVRVVDDALLQWFRDAWRCEFCGHATKAPTHPHHIYSRGAGRLDIRINLIALGGAFCCNCHGLVHAGRIKREQLLKVVALRERTTPEVIEAEVFRIRRLPKGSTL